MTYENVRSKVWPLLEFLGRCTMGLSKLEPVPFYFPIQIFPELKWPLIENGAALPPYVVSPSPRTYKESIMPWDSQMTKNLFLFMAPKLTEDVVDLLKVLTAWCRYYQEKMVGIYLKTPDGFPEPSADILLSYLTLRKIKGEAEIC